MQDCTAAPGLGRPGRACTTRTRPQAGPSERIDVNGVDSRNDGGYGRDDDEFVLLQRKQTSTAMPMQLRAYACTYVLRCC